MLDFILKTLGGFMVGYMFWYAVMLCIYTFSKRKKTADSDLPWSTNPWDRCRARREGRGGHWGRCELKRHGGDVDHALERGMNIPHWSTNWTK